MATPITGFLVSAGFCVGVWFDGVWEDGCVGATVVHAIRETINNMTKSAHKIFFIIFFPFRLTLGRFNRADASLPGHDA